MDAQRKPPVFLFVLIICALGPLAPAPGVAAEAQLIDGGGGDLGPRYAGVRIRLPGDALTYWRDPGEAGVAPSFDFSKSENLAAAEVLYPQPRRYDEAGAQAFGYKHEVTFPLRLTAKDPASPIALDVALDYSVCEKLCYPLRASLHMSLPPRADTPPDFAATLAQVPRRLNAEEASAYATIARSANKAVSNRWVLTLNALARDLLVESPAGFFVESRKDSGMFVLDVTGHPADRDAPSEPLRVTVTGQKPVEFSVRLQ
jgi:DsbC/DsbD-like thiol-disulfide interchange protein